MSERRGRSTWIFGLLAVLAVAALACGTEIEGEEGNLTFEYTESGLERAPADGALAVGSYVDVRVKDARDEDGGFEPGEQNDGEEQNDAEIGNDDDGSADNGDEANGDEDDGVEYLTIVEAYSDDAQTLDVVEERSEQFRLMAHDVTPPEGTRIHVVAEVENEDGETEELEDSFTVRTDEVASVDVGMRCEDSLFMTDTFVEATFDMRDGSGNRLTGNGFYPVEIDPAEGGTIRDDHDRIQTLGVDTGSEPGDYEVIADTGGAATPFELIDSSELDGLDLGDSDDSTLEIGQHRVTTFSLTRGDETLCGPADQAVSISSDDTDVCEVEYFNLATTAINGFHVEAVGSGTCEVTIDVLDNELEESFEVEVQ